MPRLFVNLGIIPPTGYVGPGDVVANAFAWWGLRAYSFAKIGTNAIRLRRDSDQAESDFVTLASGALDTASISTFQTGAGAASLWLTKIYDQTGNGRDLVQATAANQPGFILSAPTTGLPAVDMTANVNGVMSSPALTIAQPFTYSIVARAPAGAGQTLTFNTGTANEQLRHISTANIWNILGTASVSNTGATDNVWHAAQCIFNGTSSDLNIDGVSSTGDVGTEGFSAQVLNVFASSSGSSTWNGYVDEIGIWPIAFSAGNETSMSANQRAYWGF